MKTTKLYKTYNIIIRSIIIVISLAFLYRQLFVKQDFNSLISDISNILNTEGIWWLILCSLALMPLNWSIEALKWRYILQNKEKISVLLAIKAVFSGATISAVSPNRIGDYLGRVFVLKKTKFWEGVLITLIGSYAQTLVTLIFGGIVFFSFIGPKMIEYNYLSSMQSEVIRYVLVIGLLIGIVFYFRISLLVRIIPLKWKRVHKYVEIFKQYTSKQLSITLLFSTIRYFVFSVQFYLLFLAVGLSEISFITGLGLISGIFLINTLRPSIALLEIGIRGSVAVFVFGLYFGFETNLDNAVFTASTLIWLINIILPAIIGLFFVKDLRFFKSKKIND